MEEAIVRAADSVVCAVEKGIDIAMGEYNSKAKKKSASKKKAIEDENPPGGGKAAEGSPSDDGSFKEKGLSGGGNTEEVG